MQVSVTICDACGARDEQVITNDPPEMFSAYRLPIARVDFSLGVGLDHSSDLCGECVKKLCSLLGINLPKAEHMRDAIMVGIPGPMPGAMVRRRNRHLRPVPGPTIDAMHRKARGQCEKIKGLPQGGAQFCTLDLHHEGDCVFPAFETQTGPPASFNASIVKAYHDLMVTNGNEEGDKDD
jgi:hypothetical protein